MASALGGMTTIATSTSLGNNGKGKKLGAMFDNYGRQLSSLSVFSPISFNRSSRRGTLRLRDREKVVNTRAMEKELYFNKDGSVTKNCRSEKKLCLKEGHMHVKLHCGGSFLIHLYSILMCYFNFSWRVVLAYGLAFSCTLTESIVNLSYRRCEQTC